MLWGIRTTPNRSTDFTPFFMVYGAEAVMPSDLEHDSPRVANYVEEDNESNRRTPWIFSKRHVSSPSPELQFTSKDSAAITAAEYGAGHSRRRPGPATHPGPKGDAQAITSMGGPLHH